MNINYWNHIESMAVVDGTQQIFPKHILSLFDFLNLRPDIYIYVCMFKFLLHLQPDILPFTHAYLAVAHGLWMNFQASGNPFSRKTGKKHISPD